MEFRGHGGITHFRNSEDQGGLKLICKPSVLSYRYFLKLLNGSGITRSTISGPLLSQTGMYFPSSYLKK